MSSRSNKGRGHDDDSVRSSVCRRTGVHDNGGSQVIADFVAEPM
jgi:hypothetical protein